MTTAQLNVRLDPSLKRRGDEALSEIGVGATEAVRMLWEYAATHRSLPVDLYPDVGEGPADAAARLSRLARDGMGLALRGSSTPPEASAHLAEGTFWRDAMYDARAMDFERMMGDDDGAR